MHLAKEPKGNWDDAQQQALEALHAKLCPPGKVVQQYDPSKALFDHTDWYQQGISSVLGQKDDAGNEYIYLLIHRTNAAD
jgi:hypothetical protein